MDRLGADAYLARIGAPRPGRADAAALRRLQLCHLRAVPFENLSIHLGEEILLEEQALFDKLVLRRRGGFCYELNGLFAALLEALGFRVTLLAARVHGADGLGPPFDHLALRVDAPEPWLVDVGFGAFSHRPLRLDLDGDQRDPGGSFRVVETGDGDLDVLCENRPQYRLERRPRALADFGPTCWWQQTSPRSHFTRSLVCSRLAGAGRVTLSGRTLIRTVGGRRHEQPLGSDAEVLAAYGRHFGIHLDRVPSLGGGPGRPRRPARRPVRPGGQVR
jgi:N-hydroxyarylamine O-acetyltransferase